MSFAAQKVFSKLSASLFILCLRRFFKPLKIEKETLFHNSFSALWRHYKMHNCKVHAPNVDPTPKHPCNDILNTRQPVGGGYSYNVILYPFYTLAVPLWDRVLIAANTRNSDTRVVIRANPGVCAGVSLSQEHRLPCSVFIGIPGNLFQKIPVWSCKVCSSGLWDFSIQTSVFSP